MGNTDKCHRPLVSGILIRSGKTVNNQLQAIATGTLTGLATRNSDVKDAKKLLAATHAKICIDIDRTIVLVCY